MKFKAAAVGMGLVASVGMASAADPTTWTGSGVNAGNEVVTSFGTLSTAEVLGSNSAPAGSFAAFCVEITATYGTPLVGASAPITGTQAQQLSKLFTGAGWKSWDHTNDAIADNDMAKITALQVGVWEIVNDATFDLSAGSFNIASDSNLSSIAAMVSGWLAAGNTGLANDLYRITDAGETQFLGSQDLVIAVPEPSTYALMIAGLGAVGFVARRRKKAA